MATGSESSSNPTEPSETPKNCPACKRPITGIDVPCPACGVIPSKWKNPQQRAAEIRLAKIAESSTKTPWKFIFILFVLAAIPLSIYFVPDIQVPLLGADLSYRFDNKAVLRHQNSISYSVSVYDPQTNTTIADLDDIDLSSTVKTEVREVDTGGNATVDQLIEQMAFSSNLKSRRFPEKSPGSIPGNPSTFLISMRGNQISTPGMTQQSARDMAATAKQFQKLKQQQIERAVEKASRTTFEEKNDEAPPPPLQDPYQTRFDQLGWGDISPLSLSKAFHWPENRVRAGQHIENWMETLIWAPQGSVKIRKNASYQIKSTQRTSDGYAVLYEWNEPLTAADAIIAGDWANLLKNAAVRGQTTGHFSTRYSDGLYQDLDAQFSLEIIPSDEGVALASGQIGGMKIPKNAVIKITGHQSVQRI